MHTGICWVPRLRVGLTFQSVSCDDGLTPYKYGSCVESQRVHQSFGLLSFELGFKGIERCFRINPNPNLGVSRC